VRDWLRRVLGPDPDLLAERDGLVREVAELRQKVADTEAAWQQSKRDLRASYREQTRRAYEPVQVGDCTKIRYLHREDAEQHAIQVARKTWNEPLNAYQCRICPSYPGWNSAPWHVGGCRREDSGAMWVELGVLHHSCGCLFGLRGEEFVWVCDEHTDGERAGA
jgi:hypothetical protein